MGSQAGQPFTAVVVAAIQNGDIVALKQALRQDPDLVRTAVDGQRTLLHIATDWPGHFPNNVASVAELIAAGADVNAAFVGGHSETPLHWAASTDALRYSIPCLIVARISKPVAVSSAAVRHWLTRSPSANGRPHGDWSSGVHKPRFGRPRRWDCCRA
jgi:hypothetical protein